ncbi:hypothetical protein L195_g056729, partial [Trifolium pratense]
RLKKNPAPATKGKTPKYVLNEAEIGIGYTKPLRTIHPEAINISSSDNSEELACSSDKSQQKDKHVPSDNPFSELEKHLSPDSLNNHPFTHETTKPTSPPKPKSPPSQPHQEISTKPSSEPQPDISPAPINSPTKLTSPRKSPEPTSEPTSSEQASELNPNSSAEHVSPEHVHTCAPCPSEADVVLITNPAPESPQHSTIPYISPTSSSDPFGNLSNQLYDDLLRLSNIKNRFLV